MIAPATTASFPRCGYDAATVAFEPKAKSLGSPSGLVSVRRSRIDQERPAARSRGRRRWRRRPARRSHEVPTGERQAKQGEADLIARGRGLGQQALQLLDALGGAAGDATAGQRPPPLLDADVIGGKPGLAEQAPAWRYRAAPAAASASRSGRARPGPRTASAARCTTGRALGNPGTAAPARRAELRRSRARAAKRRGAVG